MKGIIQKLVSKLSATTPEQDVSKILNRLVGKKICFAGRFSYGMQDQLRRMAQSHQGIVQEELDASVHFLVLADLTAGKTVQKKAVSLNAKGASIRVIDSNAFSKMLQLTQPEALAIIRGGAANAALFAKAMGVTAGKCRKAGTDILSCTPEKLADAMAQIIRG